MKTYLAFLILLLSLLPLHTVAQTATEDVVYLKNGSIYRGTMVDQVYGESYKLAVAGDSVRTFLASDILKITKEQKAALSPPRNCVTIRARA